MILLLFLDCFLLFKVLRMSDNDRGVRMAGGRRGRDGEGAALLTCACSRHLARRMGSMTSLSQCVTLKDSSSTLTREEQLTICKSKLELVPAPSNHCEQDLYSR